MKKTLLFAATGVVAASIVAIAGINAAPTLLTTYVEAGTSEKSFAFGKKNAGLFVGAWEKINTRNPGYVDIDTEQGSPIRVDEFYVSGAFTDDNSSLGANGNFIAGENPENSSDFKIGFGINNLTELKVVCGVRGGTGNLGEDDYWLDADLTTVEEEDEWIEAEYIQNGNDYDISLEWKRSEGSDLPKVEKVTIDWRAESATSLYVQSIYFSWAC